MWNEPYLETCCRAALHRLCLAGAVGRPAGLRDDPCLLRMQDMGFVRETGQGRFFVTDEGRSRHAREVLKVAEGLKAAPLSGPRG
ncbi:hypothetical protein OQ252_00150 [Acetobacter farinalis]|uniref:Uncharacterized protein n=1 Tax=Acetobacter farinalis TaxID=1260984 RepID=A0ABT3Q3E8_9PROT|nr:hypothetical protein [Acetobacter farinalis]MCX2559812.1 hypothetical protein [Acetobacter farinalis]NHO28473.1 hypothetical protein [Acetobacter farinalis]